MQSYIGVKLIKAEPMTREAYNFYRGWTMPKDENGDDEGYLVVYPDGYESWSPKGQFDSAYLPLGEESTKISPAVIDSLIADVTTSRVDLKTTLVKAELVTGFVQYETSSCVDPKNYDEQVGKIAAGKKIEDRIWFALGFVLQWAVHGLNHVAKSPSVLKEFPPDSCSIGPADGNCGQP